MMQTKYIKAFTCFSRQDYSENPNTLPNGVTDKVMFGTFSADGCGCAYECSMEWVSLADGAVPHLGIFNDAFVAFQEHQQLFTALTTLHRKSFTSDDFSRLLISLGYRDLSDNKLAESR